MIGKPISLYRLCRSYTPKRGKYFDFYALHHPPLGVLGRFSNDGRRQISSFSEVFKGRFIAYAVTIRISCLVDITSGLFLELSTSTFSRKCTKCCFASLTNQNACNILFIFFSVLKNNYEVAWLSVELVFPNHGRDFRP